MRSLTGLSSEQDFRDLRVEKYQKKGGGQQFFYSAKAFLFFYPGPLAKASTASSGYQWIK